MSVGNHYAKRAASRPVVSAADTLLARVRQMKAELRDKTRQVNSEPDEDAKADLRSECNDLQRKIDKAQDELVILRRFERSHRSRSRQQTIAAVNRYAAQRGMLDLDK